MIKKKKKHLFTAIPPYLNTTNNYEYGFTEKDSNDLFNCLEENGCKYVMSEFNNSFIVDQVKKRNLNLIPITKRQTLKNRSTEIIITNYKTHVTLF